MTDIDRTLGIRWFEEVWNQGRREAIGEMLAPDGVIHDGADAMRGPEQFYPFFDRVRSTFSDMRMTVEATISEGDMICVRWSGAMTHTGDGAA
jgi:SnoaL-like polyketide cyclase